MPIGISRFADAECEITFEVTQPHEGQDEDQEHAGDRGPLNRAEHPLVEAGGGHARTQRNTARDQPQDRPVQGTQVIPAHHLRHQEDHDRQEAHDVG